VSTDPSPLHELLGGRRGALESALPSVLFVTTFLASGSRLLLALSVALVVAAALAVLRLRRRERPYRVLAGLLAVALAAAIAARTGRAADFFVPSLLANTVAALAWAVSIGVRWPLLGVVVGSAARQGRAWRRDPWLLRGYSRASWVWTASFVVRAGLMLPFWLAGNLVALGTLRVLLGWPLVLGVIALSWSLVRRTLPDDHPGLLARPAELAAHAQRVSAAPIG